MLLFFTHFFNSALHNVISKAPTKSALKPAYETLKKHFINYGVFKEI